jgi:dolichol-phosphate mannosyltransferase
MSTVRYTIILPVFNEQDNLLKLHQRLTGTIDSITTDYEMIFIDDCSNDNSYEMLKVLNEQDLRVKIIKFTKNCGHQIAITCGLDFAEGDAAIIMDADLQDPPEAIPKFIEKHEQGYEIVYAIREKREGETFFKKVTAFFFYRVMKVFTNIEMPLDAGDFRLIDRKVIDSLKSMQERNKFLRGLIVWTGYSQIGIPFRRDARNAGTTKYTTLKMFKLAFDGIFSFSNIPLRFATIFGLLVSVLSFLLAIYALYLKLSNIAVPGWTSLLLTILFIGGVQLMTIGIIGEYLGRIYDEVKMRPLYIIKKKIGF